MRTQPKNSYLVTPTSALTRCAGCGNSFVYSTDPPSNCPNCEKQVNWHGWIPTNERLPEPYQAVLCVWEYAPMSIAYYEQFPDRVRWVGNDNRTLLDSPVFWMPLPPAPEVER